MLRSAVSPSGLPRIVDLLLGYALGSWTDNCKSDAVPIQELK